MNKEVFKSIAIFAFITASLTFCVNTLLEAVGIFANKLWIPIGLGIIGAQWLAWNFYTAYLDRKNQSNQVSTVEIAQQIERMFDQYGTTVQCAFCKKNVLIPIKASADNSFECPSCEEENAVYITVERAQKTVFANDLLPDNTKGTITEARLSSNAGETPQ